MKVANSLFLTFALLLQTPFALRAEAAAAVAIPGAMAINSVIDNAKRNIEDLLDQIDATVSRNSFAIRQHLLLVLQNLDILAQELAGKTFDRLDDSQKLFFNNLNESLARWENASHLTLADVRLTLASLNDAIGTLPGSKTRPRVLGYDPAYVLPSRAPTVRVAIQGSWLGFEEPSLVLGEIPCERITKVETRLEFVCPSSALKFHNQVSQIRGLLTVYNHRSLFAYLAGLFSDNRKAYTYDLGFFTVPRRMGSFQAVVVRKVTTRETQTRSEGFNHHNDHCQGGRSHSWTVNPTAGWKIDPDSIVTRVDFKGERSHFHGVFERSESGFQLRGETNNSGSCVKWPITGGCCIAYDARGALGVTATWTEYRDVETELREPLRQGELEWQKDLSLALPEKTVSVVVEVETIDARKLVLTMGPSQLRAQDRWLEATTDLVARLTILRPRSAENALAY